LRPIGLEFDLILSTPYVRAGETAENLIPFGNPELLIGEINESYA
jgi:phosphohistidine phosphatase SixA